ncbi:MAG: RcnB family protein [Hydrogenophilaceae bacterium]|jgi:Ni/Co efflux regulator RcnB|nr:RcnB family protein [Hydrogenophilaceae bacterium]
MKSYALPLMAVLSFAAPVALSSEAAAHDHDWREDRWDRHEDRRDHREDHWDRREDRRDARYHGGRRDHYEDRWDRREDRWDRREDRWDRRGDRWDRRRHNGYWYNGRYFWGPPPAHYYRHHSYRPGYRAWRRGDRVPHYYRDRYVVVRDYHRYRLYDPPRGYHWVRDDRGDYLLVGIATGVILGLILGGGY